MSKPTSETLSRITDAARRRVEGQSWANLAILYGYASDDSALATLTQEHPDEWRDAYEKARALHLDGVEGEALLTQRELLRPAKANGQERQEQIRQSAAHSLLAHCAKLRAQQVHVTGDMAHTITGIILDASEIDNGRHDVDDTGAIEIKPAD